jgi:hypothetical protein
MSPFGLNAILTTINSAIFLCANLEGVRFLNHLGEPIPTVSEDPSERPDGIAYFVFDATVPPVQTDNRLASLATFTIRFALPLPQHDRSSSTAVNPPPDTVFCFCTVFCTVFVFSVSVLFSVLFLSLSPYMALADVGSFPLHTMLSLVTALSLSRRHHF